ncbi:MAG: hypothetical protein ACT4PN_16275 [Nitrospiraceae bacterium]
MVSLAGLGAPSRRTPAIRFGGKLSKRFGPMQAMMAHERLNPVST